MSYLALEDIEVNSMMMGFSRDHPWTKSKVMKLLKICNLSHRPGFVRVPHNDVGVRARGDQPFLKKENKKLRLYWKTVMLKSTKTFFQGQYKSHPRIALMFKS